MHAHEHEVVSERVTKFTAIGHTADSTQQAICMAPPDPCGTGTGSLLVDEIVETPTRPQGWLHVGSAAACAEFY